MSAIDIDLDDLEAKARAALDEAATLFDRDRAAYQFRAAANPAAVLELLERLRAAEEVCELTDSEECHGAAFESGSMWKTKKVRQALQEWRRAVEATTKP